MKKETLAAKHLLDCFVTFLNLQSQIEVAMENLAKMLLEHNVLVDLKKHNLKYAPINREQSAEKAPNKKGRPLGSKNKPKVKK